jgi:Domain of unknown function (DUF397)
MRRVLLWNRPSRQRPSFGPSWFKSSLSFSSGNCVEVAEMPQGTIGVRNSRHAQGPVLQFTPSEWKAFLAGVRNGEFDKLGGT